APREMTREELLQLARELTGISYGVTALAFSPDGARIASGSADTTLKVWDAGTGEELLSLVGHTGGVRAVGFSPEGSRIASASEYGPVKVWDASTGQELACSDPSTSWGTTGLVWSPSGSRVVWASGATVKVWDASTGEVRHLCGHKRDVNAVACSPD